MSQTIHGDVGSPVAIAAIGDALRAFAKALRAMQLYLPNNPTRATAIENARAAFTRAWLQVDRMQIAIHESSLIWDDHVVYDDSSRGTDGLPWLMYRDGLRLLCFEPDFELEALDELLAIFIRARSAPPDEDDLVTLLWVADIAHLTYQHVESNPAGLHMPTADAEPAGAERRPPSVQAQESEPVGDGPPPGVIRLEDFDETLYFLDPRESAYLQAEVRREYEADPRQGAVAALFEIIAMPTDVATRLEALEIVDRLLLEFLTSADFEMAAVILRDAAFTRGLVSGVTEVEQGLAGLSARISQAAVMAQLLQAVDDAARAPKVELLETLFVELQPTALQSLLGWIGAAQNSVARASVERASLRLAAAHTAELTRLLEHADPDVVHGALRIATGLASAAAVPALGRLMASTSTRVRTEAVGALREIGTPGALRTLEAAVDDVDREVRVAALRAIALRSHRPALARLSAAIRRKETRSADLAEKMALFEAFGTVCGDDGVAELDSLLNSRGLLGSREPTETRACAARALGLIGSAAATAALQRAVDSKDMVVRSAVTRALRGGA
ncbi:MAG TPA: HEAT repeat domain-containing protein [Gemmatimonas sp.]|nr:HEAT repeat domain-containing protein [Gemmatimonas sp.]